MADQRLVSYIREQLNNGYDLYKIKNHLIKYGYSSAAVDDAINEIYKPHTVKHEIHLSKSTIIAVSSIFITITIIISVFFIYDQEPKQLLDLSIDVTESSVKAGQLLNFNFEVSNLGASGRYDVLLRYDVVKEKKIITSKEETIAVETKASSKNSISIPNNAEQGDYTLKATAKYDGKIATASDSFSVYRTEKVIEIPEKEPEPEEKPVEEEIIEEEIVEEEEIIEEETTPTEESELAGLTIWEKLEKIKEISSSDPEKAGNYCQEIDEQVHRDRCFLNIAEITMLETTCSLIEDTRLKDDCYSKVASLVNNYELCEKISTETTDRKDSCYMNFVMEGNYDVCNRLVNEYLKQSCDALKSIGG